MIPCCNEQYRKFIKKDGTFIKENFFGINVHIKIIQFNNNLTDEEKMRKMVEVYNNICKCDCHIIGNGCRD